VGGTHYVWPDAEKYLLLACLNLVECVAYIGAAAVQVSSVRPVEMGSLDAHVPPEQAPVVMPHLPKAMAGEKVEFDYAIRRTPGEPADHRHVVLAPARQSDGSFNGVLAFVNDVTARENALLQASETAREILELKAALDAHAIVAVTDAKGVIVRVNDKFCSISKYPREELAGKTHRIIKSSYHLKGFFRDMWKTMSSGMVWNGEVCNKAKDGSLYWVHTTIVPLMGPKGVPEQYIALRADIPMRKEAEAEAQRMALHDSLTGLPNRRLMGDRLKHALHTAQRERKHGALLILDMDNFKDVNDSSATARATSCCVRLRCAYRSACAKATQWRAWAGTSSWSFWSTWTSTSPRPRTRRSFWATRFARSCASRFRSEQRSLTPAPASASPLREGSPEPDELVKRADMALYKAKEEGRTVGVLHPQLQAESTAAPSCLESCAVLSATPSSGCTTRLSSTPP